MLDVRANTQVIVPIGPFVDVTDGFTPETGITLGAADEAELLKHGSTSVVDIAAATWAAITSMDGHYALTLTASHTDTEGQLTVVVQDDSVCLPVRMHFRVLSEAAYDSLYVAKDDGFMDVNIKTIGRADTQETEASNLEAAAAAYSATRGLAGTALPAAAADAAGGLAISDAGGLDLDAKIGALTYTVANKVDSNISTIVGVTPTVGASLDFPTQIASRTNITGGTITTVTTLTGHTPQTGDSFARIGAPAGASVSADVAAVKVDTAATLADTGTDGVVVAAASKTGYALTATTGLGNQTADITGSLSGSVGSVTGAVGSVTGAVGSVTGAVGSVTGAVGSVTGNVGGNVTGSIGSLAAQAKADVTTAASNRVQKNTALAGFTFLMVLSSDHVTPGTGLTITATRSLDGAAFGACANSAAEVSAGVYKIDLAAGDLNGNTVMLKFTAATADARYVLIATQPT